MDYALGMLLFVYGTLMRGESRFGQIPCPPVWIHPARTTGRLLSIAGLYPGLVEGHGEVHGELMNFRDENAATVLKALDEIEGYLSPGHPENLYNRCHVSVVDCHTGQTVEAWTYFYVKKDGPWPVIAEGRWREPVNSEQ